MKTISRFRPAARVGSMGCVAGLGAALILLGLPGQAMADSKTKSSSRSSSSSSSGGALSRTTRAVSGSSGSSSSQPAASGSSSTSRDSDTSGMYYEPEYGSSGNAVCYTCGPVGAPYTQKRNGPPPRLALRLGMQSVKDSDGAFIGSLRVLRRRIGLGVSGAHYFERAPALDGSDRIYMNLWSFHGIAEVFGDERTKLFVTGGLSGAGSNNFEEGRFLGPAVGAEVEYRLNDTLALQGGARYYILEHGVRAREARAGVVASFLSVGYRIVEFDADGAVPLQGPEFSIVLRR